MGVTSIWRTGGRRSARNQKQGGGERGQQAGAREGGERVEGRLQRLHGGEHARVPRAGGGGRLAAARRAAHAVERRPDADEASPPHRHRRVRGGAARGPGGEGREGYRDAASHGQRHVGHPAERSKGMYVGGLVLSMVLFFLQTGRARGRCYTCPHTLFNTLCKLGPQSRSVFSATLRGCRHQRSLLCGYG